MEVSASYLSAVSVMLAAYGFFYGLYRETIRAGLEVGEASENEIVHKEQVARVGAARSAAAPLGLVPLVVWLIFLGPVVEEIAAGFDVGFSLDRYSAIDVAFVLAANAWIVIAAIVLSQAYRLWRKGRELG